MFSSSVPTQFPIGGSNFNGIGAEVPQRDANGNYINTPIKALNPSTALGAAANTQASDYDRIMKQYNDLLNTSKSQTPVVNTAITPQIIKPNPVNYTASPELGNALGVAGGFASSGGYSGADIQSLRERAISPIRAIYANAQQNIERQKALQGGYSPNYTAATTRMARDSSEQIGKAANDANAGIAEAVQRGKLAGLSALAPLSQTAASQEQTIQLANQRAEQEANLANQGATNRASEFNASMPLQVHAANQNDLNQQMAAIEGMLRTYGTSPALVNTYGSIAGNAANASNTADANKLRAIFGL